MHSTAYAACAVYAAGLVAVGLTVSRGRPKRGWPADIGRQLAERIRSELPLIRSAAIEQAHYFATYHREVDLSDAVPALVDVYEHDPVARYRLAAVVTLHAMGDEYGMRAVSRHLPKQTDRYVQIISIAALRDHFGTNSYFNSNDVSEISAAIIAGLNPPGTEPPSSHPD